MKRLLVTGLIACTSLLGAPRANADWNEFWAQFERDRSRNEAWPHAFLRADQQAVRQTFRVMVDRGWEQQLVFQHFHFDTQSNELNELGEKKLRWILSQAPSERSQIFVQQTLDEDINSARMLAIQTRATEIAANSGRDISPSNASPYHLRGVAADQMTGSVLSASTGVGQVQGGGGSPGGSSSSGN